MGTGYTGYRFYRTATGDYPRRWDELLGDGWDQGARMVRLSRKYGVVLGKGKQGPWMVLGYLREPADGAPGQLGRVRAYVRAWGRFAGPFGVAVGQWAGQDATFTGWTEDGPVEVALNRIELGMERGLLNPAWFAYGRPAMFGEAWVPEADRGRVPADIDAGRADGLDRLVEAIAAVDNSGGPEGEGRKVANSLVDNSAKDLFAMDLQAEKILSTAIDEVAV